MSYKNPERKQQYDRLRTAKLTKQKNLERLNSGKLSWNQYPDYFWSRVDIKSDDECWLWKHKIDTKGYGRLKYKNKYLLAHRLAFKLFYGDFPRNCACHKCDTPSCCNPHHLFDGTQADNIRDMIQKGRCGNKGETNGRAKITDKQVLEIREYIKVKGDSNLTRKYLMVNFNIHRATLSDVILGKTFKHLL